MPRQRKPKAKEQVPLNASETTNESKKGLKMALTAEQIRGIYAKRRTKGMYNELLDVFLNSGENGVSVKEEWNTQLAEKKASTLKQGFENAKDRKDAPNGSELVDVIVDGDDVFLINRAAVDVEAELAAA